MDMKRLIKKILKESITEKIIDKLREKGFKIFDYLGILKYLNDLGFEKDESEKLYREYSGIVGEPRIDITSDNDVTYEIDLVDGVIEIYGHLDFYHTGRDEEHEFEPDDFGDKKSEIYYDYNWELVGEQIYRQYIDNQFQKYRKK
jgi:hypothetical protein